MNRVTTFACLYLPTYILILTHIKQNDNETTKTKKIVSLHIRRNLLTNISNNVGVYKLNIFKYIYFDITYTI